ncbi:MAG TPA: HAMP domain-containing sensor histidine kinase [Gemmatimonadaceae bacterium]|nr:HAMP domain-containing sensor histidine kinase [Gemmatimonadaceae bacterium]
MTLRSRLALGLATIAIILVIPLLIAVQSLDKLHREARALQTEDFAGSLLLGGLREGLFDLRRMETRLLFVHDSDARDAMASQIDEVRTLTDSLEHYKLADVASDVRRAVGQIARWGPAEYQAALSGRTPEADTISARYLVPALDSADAGVRVAESKLRERTRDRIDRSALAITQTRTAAMLGLALALGLAAVIAFWLFRFITKPVIALEAGMRAVADGQLDHKLKYDTTRQHEFGRLARSFESMARQLEELDKLKAEFVSVASHELKTPINVVIGYIQLMEEGIYGPLTPKQLEIHKTLAKQMAQLQRLTQQLLDVSRFEAGGGRVEPRSVDLPRMLEELERAFDVLAIQRGVKFEVRRGPELPAEVTWDKDRINEVLGNLLSNAFKFTGQGGQVTLTVEDAGDKIEMKVRDTGAGIPAEQLSRVFEKFYQADNQGSASAAGTGLGLAIVKGIVEAHGGHIRCESKVGVGTTFIIELPKTVRRRSMSIQRPMPTPMKKGFLR